ncbi:MAG: hypothetical protein IJE43_25070 [Alphaproteobacteria bacterium]|nr:hypothetical protein [Alphaproteobacteria bacterium]MBQ6849539.1 hypothetical protein [Oscillospiraceae bacterium]
MDIKTIIKNKINQWIDNEVNIDPRDCMFFLYEPERPISKPEDIEK